MQRTALVLCLGLVASVWFVFGQTLGHEFVNYDDPVYVLEPPQVNRGLTWEGVAWAFQHQHAGNWHPLTSLSHMLDCEIYGLKPAGHHFTNVLLHTIAVLLLFAFLRVTTGAMWRSAFVAAVFAIHPLRVESVAWVAERKDVLSAVFFFLTLLAYAWYVRRPSVARYAIVAGTFALGLMAKPMLVTLPCVLLLLDFWPLNRSTRFWKLAVEKIPLLVLAGGAAVATLLVQTGTMSSLERLPFSWRVANAAVSTITYLRQMIWPADLGVFYPHPRDQISVFALVGSVLLLAAITAAALLVKRSRRYVPVGWLWYLGMLVPVAGLVQVGLQSHADRYTYLPQVGIYVIIAWGICDLTHSWKRRRVVVGAAAALVLLPLAFVARAQASHWRDSKRLWRHTLAVAPGNAVAHTNLGNILPIREAVLHYEEALKADPNASEPMNNLAWVLATFPSPEMRDATRALQLADRADRGAGRRNALYARTLAAAYANAGRFTEAIDTAGRALALAEAEGNAALAFDLRNNIAGFRLRDPVRDTSLLDPSPVN